MEINLNTEEIHKHIADKIIQSQIGRKLEERIRVIDSEMDKWINNAYDQVIKDEINNILLKQMVNNEDFVNKLKEKTITVLTESRLEQSVDECVNRIRKIVDRGY